MRFIGLLCVFVHLNSVTAGWGRHASPKNEFPLLLDATLDELRAGLEAGSFTSVDLVNAYIARIQEVHAELRPVTEINPDALEIAAQLDEQRLAGRSSSPIHGIPILVKDNIATHDEMNNTAGSYALLGAKVPEDSTVVAKLRKAGAIILGKTNLSEWAGCRSGNSSQGWSGYGGQTVAAYFPNQDPSGSSSGSAVASSLGLAWASLGTETAGSIIHPSHLSNLVGIKPTVGLTSRYLVVPISEHSDTVGPMARTVKDAAHLLSAIVGPDRHDNYTDAIPFDEAPDYVAACRYSGLKGKRLGISRDLLEIPLDPTIVNFPAAFEEALDVLRAAGAEIIDNVTLPGLEPLLNNTSSIRVFQGGDFQVDLPTRYLNLLETNPNNITSVKDLQEFTRNHPLEDYPERDTFGWDAIIENGYSNDSPEFWDSYKKLLYYAGPLGLTGALNNHSLDAVIAPGLYVSLLSTLIGTPAITVPMARMPDGSPVVPNDFGNLDMSAPNQPIGLGFAGDAFSEVKLIEMAYAFEQRTLVWNKVKPCIQPKTELADVVADGRQKGRKDLR